MTPATRARRYWLVKSEPDSFSFDDLLASPDRITCWDGVRNYQARNTMRDDMKLGDLVFFYHSSTDPSAIVGIAEVVRESYPDHTAFDRKDSHYDPKSKGGESAWSMVDIRAVERLSRPVTLAEMRARPELAALPLLQKGQRLSVQKVGAAEWNAILALAHEGKSGD